MDIKDNILLLIIILFCEAPTYSVFFVDIPNRFERYISLFDDFCIYFTVYILAMGIPIINDGFVCIKLHKSKPYVIRITFHDEKLYMVLLLYNPTIIKFLLTQP